MSKARRPSFGRFGLILTPLSSGCVYPQWSGLFPSGGAVQNSLRGKTIVAGGVVDEQGLPRSGIVVLEHWNDHPTSFVWTKTPADIIAKAVRRGR